MSNKYVDQVLNACLIAGRIMIESGSEMYRVEDTITRIAKNAGINNIVVFTTPTGLFVGLNGEAVVQMQSIRDRSVNLEKVARVNSLSRRFAAKEIDINELQQKIGQVDRNVPAFPFWLQTIGAAVVSAMLMVIFLNDYYFSDFWTSGVIGALGFVIYTYVKRYTDTKFLSELLAAMVIGFLGIFAARLHLANGANAVIIGAVMPLVPGLAMTNSLRDLFAGHLLTGMARGVEAILTAIAMGGGIAIMIKFFAGV